MQCHVEQCAVATVRRPSERPVPSSPLPAVWIPLKVLQSVAAWLVWRSAPTTQQLYLPLALFVAHLFLGSWWNVSVGCPSAPLRCGASTNGVHRPACILGLNCPTPAPSTPLQVVFFGRHQMQQSVKWMAAFWCSIAASIAAFSQVRCPCFPSCLSFPLLSSLLCCSWGCHLQLCSTTPDSGTDGCCRCRPSPASCLLPRNCGSPSPPSSTGTS